MKHVATIYFLLSMSMLQAQTLAEYMKWAVEQNPGLQSKHKEFEAALEKVDQVSTLPDPNFTVSTLGRMIETRTGPQQAVFILNQMFPWFGTLAAQGDVAALAAEASFQSYLDARNKLQYQVASAYYPLYELREWIRIEQEFIRILQSDKDLSTSSFQNNRGSMVDVLRADIMLKESETNLHILMKKEKPLLAAFNQLLNRELDEPVELESSLTTSVVESMDKNDSSLMNHPQIREMELRIQSAKAAEQVAHKQGLPMLGVGVNYTLIGQREDLAPGTTPPADNGQDAFMPMVSVSLPIFRKKYEASKREIQLMQESYRLKKVELSNELLLGYETTWFELQKQQELIALYEDQIRETRQAVNLTLTAYRNASMEFEEVLTMQQQLLTYEKMKVSAVVQYLIAVAKIDYLTSKQY